MLGLGANTNVLTHAGKTLALVEGGVANYELTDELDTVGTCDFDGTLAGGYTAHPHRDPETGELHAVSYSFARGRTVQYSVIDTARPRPSHGRHRGVRIADDARLLADREIRGDLRPAGDVRPDAGAAERRCRAGCNCRPGWWCSRCSDASGSPARSRRWINRNRAALVRLPVRLEQRLSGAHRRHASRRRQQRRALVRHRALLRLPPAQRLLGDPRRAPRCWCSTWCATRGCSTATGAAPATACPPWTGGPSTWRPAR